MGHKKFGGFKILLFFVTFGDKIYYLPLNTTFKERSFISYESFNIIKKES